MHTAEIVQMGIVAFMIGLFIVLPIVFFLLEHQRKMASIMRGAKENDPSLEAEIVQLRSEIRDLRSELRSLGVPEHKAAEKLRDHLSSLG